MISTSSSKNPLKNPSPENKEPFTLKKLPKFLIASRGNVKLPPDTPRARVSNNWSKRSRLASSVSLILLSSWIIPSKLVSESWNS